MNPLDGICKGDQTSSYQNVGRLRDSVPTPASCWPHPCSRGGSAAPNETIRLSPAWPRVGAST